MCRWGKFVAHHPWPVIGTTFTITTLCSLGFLLFRFIIINILSSIIYTCFCRIQYATDELWIPSTSPFKSNKEWKNTHFKKNTRYENIMFSGENVLTPAGLQQVVLPNIVVKFLSVALLLARCTESTNVSCSFRPTVQHFKTCASSM